MSLQVKYILAHFFLVENSSLKYISDSLGTDAEMQVHKFAEEAMYKCIAYAIMSTRANVQEYIVRRFKKINLQLQASKIKIIKFKNRRINSNT